MMKTKIMIGVFFAFLLIVLSLASAQACTTHNSRTHPLILREPLFTLQPDPDSSNILVTGSLEGTPGDKLTIHIILQVTPTQITGLTHGQATFTWTDKNDDQIMGTLDGYIKANSDTESAIFFTFTITAGTGRYEGATGKGIHWGTITTNPTTGVSSGSGWYVGTIKY